MSKKDDDRIKNPSTTSFEYEVMRPRWEQIDALLSGTEGMRAAGELYLPQHPAEADDAYRERLACSTLFNMTELTLDSLVGRPFSDSVQVSDAVPESMEAILDDINLQGDGIDVYARQWFRTGLAKAFGATLVEFPRTNQMAGRTLDDDRRDGVRPYWVSIPPENIIFATTQFVNGVEQMTHVRFREEVIQRVGFAQVVSNQIRSFDLIAEGQPVMLDGGVGVPPGGFSGDAIVVENTGENDGSVLVSFDSDRVMVTIFAEDLEKSEESPERWFVADVFFMEIDEIPLVIYYAERDGVLLGKPSLLDLSYMNVSHWQSASDQTTILKVARFPILASAGMVDDTKIKIGPHNWLNTPEANGKWYYVEHSGAAIDAGRIDLEDSEKRMSEYGAQFLKRSPGNQTATARALDTAESTSALEDMAIRFNDSLQSAWRLTGKWMGVEPDTDIGTLTVSNDFDEDDFDPNQLSELGNARRARDLSRPSYFKELERRGVLAEDFDQEENERELDEERAEFGDGFSNIDIDPAGGDPDPEGDPKTGGDPDEG